MEATDILPSLDIAIFVESTGIFAFNIDASGDLILSYPGAEVVDMEINVDEVDPNLTIDIPINYAKHRTR